MFAGLVGGVLVGWFLRHKILDRQLFQTRKQLNEMRALQMNLEHEVSAVRQKLIQQEDSQSNMRSMVEESGVSQKKAEEASLKLEEMQEQMASLQQDNDELEEQIAYLEAEKSNLQKFREQSQEKMQQIAVENRQLREMISELQRTSAAGSIGGKRPEVVPAVRRIPTPEGTADSSERRQTDGIKGQPSTSRIKTRQGEATDRVKTRESGEVTADREQEDGERRPQEKTSAITIRPVDPSSETDAGNQASGTDVPELKVDSDPEESHFDEDTGIRDLIPAVPEIAAESEPVVLAPKPRKKKPKTVRIDRSSSDIIDSFKRDLGLPGK